jgi:hypothetical protein
MANFRLCATAKHNQIPGASAGTSGSCVGSGGKKTKGHSGKAASLKTGKKKICGGGKK